ncbi:hypothetical protein KP509_20G026100 [Ceratopteris richardii]|uniref:DUF7148 domain-containing protein n=1 Tax=Ceratopteris richardii TaxID=49495 RepID=A0A8T2SH03_CERRI|nr:hypothetical protein KP509_20G026100 [Ceratopteris richardii]
MAVVATISLQFPGQLRVQGHFSRGIPTAGFAQRTTTRILVRPTKLDFSFRSQASSSELAGASDWGEPVSLGTVKLPANVDLERLEVLLYQWGNSLTQNANLPLPVPIKVDKIEGGVRLGYIRLVDGAIENIAHIDCLVFPGTKDSSAMFRALRNGQLKDQVPPGEPVIMQSLLQCLKKSIELAKL